MNKLRHIIPLFCIAAVVLPSCSTTKSAPPDPCIEYNQGMRVTSNREWPNAIDMAEDIVREMRLSAMSVRYEGPYEYERLAKQYEGVLAPQIL